MDCLDNADMVSVVDRTNLKPNEENLLLPIYESISNAIYSTKEKWGGDISEKGKIIVDIKTANFSAEISDNGVGLDDINYHNFKTPFTGYKLKRGGKGFGRFVGFKVFDNISYKSRYFDGKTENVRSFDFDIYDNGKEFKESTRDLNLNFSTGCIVHYSTLKDEFITISAKIKEEEYIERIIRYFLPFFLSNDIPLLEIIINGAHFNTRDYFLEFFCVHEKLIERIIINNEEYEFNINISKIPKNSIFKHHSILLFADGRIIGQARDIEAKIGVPDFKDKDDKKVVYLATIEGVFLNERANTARTHIEATEAEIDEIAKVVSSKVISYEEETIKHHRSIQARDVKAAIFQTPILRSAIGSTTVEEYVSSKPMNWKTENYVADLALQRHRKNSALKKTIDEIIKSPKAILERRKEIETKLDNDSKEVLASYVAHRKSVIEYVEKILGYQADGSMAPEDAIHEIIHPRYEDSETTLFYTHNLWLLDDKLSFFNYCSSDRTMQGSKRKLGDKVPDIVFFDDCSLYQEESNKGVIVLIEFKKPGRDDYNVGSKSDPVKQVIETADYIRSNKSFTSKTGNTISIPDNIRIYSYIVADIKPTLSNLCEHYDLKRTWDKLGYFKYHENKDLMIEVIGYNDMLEIAQKRNTAFFNMLLGDL